MDCPFCFVDSSGESGLSGIHRSPCLLLRKIFYSKHEGILLLFFLATGTKMFRHLNFAV